MFAPRIGPLRLPVVLAAVAFASSVGVYLASPDGLGGLAFVGVAAAGLTALLVGPGLRRARPAGSWRWMAGAAALLLTGLALRFRLLPAASSPLLSPDAWIIAGYAATVRGLTGLVRHAARGSARAAALDATIVTAGTALGFFSAEVGPHLRQSANAAAITLNVLYPVLDAALLSLTVHLAFRTCRRSPSMVLLLAGMTSWLVADLGYVVLWHTRPAAISPWLNAVFMLAYALIGAAAVHPSVTDLASPSPDARPHSAGSRMVLLLTLLIPASVAVVAPISGWLDAAIRIVLLSTVLSAIQLRMTYTVGELSRAADALEKTQERALHQALHDTLTGLPNRVALVNALRERLDAEAPPGAGITLMCLNSDRFKQVNDTWGHPAGDEVILALARRLAAALSPEELLFRLGGDEFGVLAPGADPGGAADTAQRLLTAAAVPYLLATGQKIRMTASIGVAQAAPGQAIDADTLVRDADTALYAAKDAGRATWVVFDESLRSSLERRVVLADDLRDAVLAGQIVPYFQPIVAGAGYAHICGFEALARWISPHHGNVSPAEFIPIAEDTGVILDIGEHILRSACHQISAWRTLTGQDLHVSVNVSAAQITRTDLPGLVHDAVVTSGLSPHALWLEITESLLLRDRKAAIESLRRLAEIGVVLCVDDFGTGYSSLSYLKDFPVDVVKVDRSFVQGLTLDRKARGVTKAIIEMARALELRGVVAEGVELPEQATLLETWGCGWAQGFLWARPLHAVQAEALISGRTAITTWI